MVHSLCIADQLGALKSIEHIARTLLAANQPPPPPYISYTQPRENSKSQQSAEVASNSVTTENSSLEAASVGILKHHPFKSLKVSEDNACLETSEREQGRESDVNSEQSGSVNMTDMTLKEKDPAKSGSDSEEESCDSQNTAPLQSQSMQSTGIGLESGNTSYVERDGLRRENPQSKLVELKSAPSNIEQKLGDETQAAAINNATNNALVLFGIGAGTFMY